MVSREKGNFLSSDKRTKIVYYVWQDDEVETKRGILQMAHGMTEHIGRYDEFATYMAEQGFIVVGNDHLGHGASVVSKREWGYFSEIEEHPMFLLVQDMHTLRGIIEEKYKSDNLPYFMLGHSMGSYVLRAYLCMHSDGLAGAILVGTGKEEDSAMKLGMGICKALAKMLGWHHRGKLIKRLSAGPAYKGYNMDGSDIVNSWLSHNVEDIKNYFADERCTFTFTLNGYYALMDVVLYDNQKENIAKTNKDVPLFIISGEKDPVGNLGVGVKEVYDMYEDAGMKDITWKLYKDDRHEILHEPDRDVVFKDILSWINVRL
ncbi:MAG: lysophospholipase [Lachnospiraceae bacterium]|nr:lysophospholipase [Lachnospiraceae bacterium]